MAAFFFIVALLLVLIQTGIVGKLVWGDAESWKWMALAALLLWVRFCCYGH